MAKRIDNNTILSITATIVSVCALFVAVYQTVLMGEQQNAAVWPKLVISHGYLTNVGDSSFYRLEIRNVGIGPAVIRKVAIRYKKNHFTKMAGYAEFVLATHNALGKALFDTVDLLPEDVIPQGETVVLFNTYQTRYAEYFY